MILTITLLVFATTALLILAGYYIFAPQTSQVVERLELMKQEGVAPVGATEEEEKGPDLREIAQRIVGSLGRVFRPAGVSSDALRRRLAKAGFYGEAAVVSFNGIRLMLAVGLPLFLTLVLTLLHVSVVGLIFSLPLLALLGFFAPSLVLDSMITNRKDRITKGLADAVDLMVSCVEAGLSLNAAIVRVAVELRKAHPDIAQEFELCGFEMRAGKSREEAFRNLDQRTGVKDLKSFAAMLIQTDRFGTSISRALRVFADSLRTKRRQRAEEAAAKTTIKLVFPLVFFIFPAILVVLLGPGMIKVMEALRSVVNK